MDEAKNTQDSQYTLGLQPSCLIQEMDATQMLSMENHTATTKLNVTKNGVWFVLLEGSEVKGDVCKSAARQMNCVLIQSFPNSKGHAEPITSEYYCFAKCSSRGLCYVS